MKNKKGLKKIIIVGAVLAITVFANISVAFAKESTDPPIQNRRVILRSYCEPTDPPIQN